MSKAKSVVMTVLISIVVVILCLMCVVSLDSVPFTTNRYNSVVSVIKYGSDLGGGYSAVYYPEGVISASEYNRKIEQNTETLRRALSESGITATGDYAALKAAYEAATDKQTPAANKIVEDTDSFLDEYNVAWDGKKGTEGSSDSARLYLNGETVCEVKDGKYVVSESFKKDFDQMVKVISNRFKKKNYSYLNIAIVDGYAIHVEVPSSVGAAAGDVFNQLSYTGEIALEGASDTAIFRLNGGHTLSEYVKKVTTRRAGENTFVAIHVTSAGKKALSEVEGESDKITLRIGEETLFEVTASKTQLDGNTWYIGGSDTRAFTRAQASNVAILLNSYVDGQTTDLSVGSGGYGGYTLASFDNIKLALYLIFGIAILVMTVCSVIRYRGLGITHLLAFLSFFVSMLMFIALPGGGMLLQTSGVVALLLTSVLMVVTNYYIFEQIRREFNTGKTLETAVKDGYRHTTAAVLDTHILLFGVALITFFIAISELKVFATILMLGVVASFVASYLLTRFYWYCMRGLLPRAKQYKFSGFVREVIDDEED